MDDQDSSDYHNFSQLSSPTHRLPTLNGAQALFDAIEEHKPISTGLAGLDATLCSSSEALSADCGLPRGRLTEVYGAPGSGKTHLAVQLAANALKQDDNAKVVWIDTSSQLPYTRLKQYLEPQKNQENAEPAVNGVESEDVPPIERLDHMYFSSFPHLLATLLHPSQDFPPGKTTLLVIDTLSSIATTGLPQNDRVANNSTTNGTLSREDIISKTIAARRSALLSAVSAGLARLAASHNIAVLVLNNTATHRKYGGKNSVLRSALNVAQWNENVSNRIVIYRDFWPRVDWSRLDREEARKQRARQKWPLRIAEVERVGGKEVRAQGTKFVILKSRLQAVEPPNSNSVTVTIRDIAPASSPPLLVEDNENEEAMGNLGLEDVEGTVDPSMRMPEDVPSSAAQTPAASKRRIDEVADSEDEDGDEIEFGSAARPPPLPMGINGFLPSSQVALEREGDEDGESESSGDSGVEDQSSAETRDTTSNKQDLEEDMLLQS